MAADPVRVAFTKYDGSLHWHHTMMLLGEDDHGVWLGARPGTTARKGHDGPVVTTAHTIIQLFPRDGWWAAQFFDAPKRHDLYCDITTPPRWPHPGEVTMVDLDLDVVRERGKPAKLVDEDEFAEHQVRYAYPPDVVAQAQAAAQWLLEAVASGSGPFGGAHRHWRELFG